MPTIERTLADHPIFAGLRSSSLCEVIDAAERSTFEAGHIIFREGEPADRVYVVQGGTIALEVFRLAPGPIVVQVLGDEEVIGWSWLVPPYRWRFDARAVTKAAALAIDAQRLREACERAPDLGYELHKRFMVVVEQRVQAMRVQLVEQYCRAA